MINAAQLSASMQAAVLEQFGPDQSTEKFPSKYFNYGVFVIAPDGTPTQRAPKYCATTLGASEIAQIFAPSSPENGGTPCTAVVLGNAVNFSGLLSGWSDTELVPYLAFGAEKAGPYVNCGLLLDYFNHGWSPAKALEYAQAEVKGAK